MILIRINCPDPATAEAIAHHAVEASLAACANITAPIRSVYRWQGRIEQAEETVVFLKSRAALFEHVEKLVCRLHPDEVPAILAIPIERTTDAFGRWAEAETGGA
jgi:periplasmic divalent cation tolerance protein